MNIALRKFHCNIINGISQRLHTGLITMNVYFCKLLVVNVQVFNRDVQLTSRDNSQMKMGTLHTSSVLFVCLNNWQEICELLTVKSHL